MNPTQPQLPMPRGELADAQMRNWLRLRRELTELNARLEYVRLILSLGVRQIH